MKITLNLVSLWVQNHIPIGIIYIQYTRFFSDGRKLWCYELTLVLAKPTSRIWKTLSICLKHISCLFWLSGIHGNFKIIVDNNYCRHLWFKGPFNIRIKTKWIAHQHKLIKKYNKTWMYIQKMFFKKTFISSYRLGKQALIKLHLQGARQKDAILSERSQNPKWMYYTCNIDLLVVCCPYREYIAHI